MKKNILENAGHGSLGHRIFCILRDKILNEEYEKRIQEVKEQELDKQEERKLIKEIRNEMHDRLIEHMNSTRDLYRGYQWRMRPWRKDFIPNWENEGYTRQRENEEYEPRQLDYDTGLPMESSVRKKC